MLLIQFFELFNDGRVDWALKNQMKKKWSKVGGNESTEIQTTSSKLEVQNQFEENTMMKKGIDIQWKIIIRFEI